MIVCFICWLLLSAVGAAAFIDSHKKQLSYANAALLASVPWMQVGG
jgi:nitrate/nitrite transporter NarK